MRARSVGASEVLVLVVVLEALGFREDNDEEDGREDDDDEEVATGARAGRVTLVGITPQHLHLEN